MTALCWLAIAPGLVWLAVRLLGVESGPGVQVIAFTPYAAAWTLVPAVLALALRRWRAAAVAGLVVVGFAAGVLPRAIPGDPGPASGSALRVLTANVLAGTADPAALADLVRRERVDVLALQEFTPQIEMALDGHGLTTVLPHRVAAPLPGTPGSALYSRFPLTATGVRANEGGFRQAYGTLTVPGAAPVQVESVHPLAPYAPRVVPLWRADLAAQPAATPDGPVRILIGDFNATLDHAALRRLIDTGYHDAADVAGAGLVGTWGPYDGDPIPPVTIDHVLVDRRIGVRAVAVHHLRGSDHRPLLAELVLPT
ncbi:MAG TPA: endonuclease/exonuclease/phosphatase family protein [Pilimelia sp.]|nr:endonuclease/exonuclease/phosphatase family protein [Pilimelia sp.]